MINHIDENGRAVTAKSKVAKRMRVALRGQKHGEHRKVSKGYAKVHTNKFLEKRFRSYKTKDLTSHIEKNAEMAPIMRSAVRKELLRRSK